MKRESSPWLGWGLLILALLLLILNESGTLAPFQGLLGYVVAPVERIVARVVRTVGSLTQSTRDVQVLQEQLAELQRSYDALVEENFRLREYQAENEQLRRLLNFQQENPTYSVVGADVVERGCLRFPCGEVVGRDVNPYLRYIVVNVGTRDGVAVGMPVVTGGAAMIGRIARTSPNLSYVQLINDPASRIAAMLQQSRITGMLEGSEQGDLVMTDILPDEQVAPGETVVTSSIGGLLPRGLVLGQVETVSYVESELFQRASVRPALDFEKVETVLVITDFPQPDLSELEIQ